MARFGSPYIPPAKAGVLTVTAPCGADPTPVVNRSWEELIHPRVNPWYSVFDRIEKSKESFPGEAKIWKWPRRLSEISDRHEVVSV